MGAVVVARFGAVPEVKFMPKCETVKRAWSKGDISSLKSVMFTGDTQEKILCPR